MDGLFVKSGIIQCITPSIAVSKGIGSIDVRANPNHVVKVAAGNSVSVDKATAPPRRTSSWGFSIGHQLRSFWPGTGGRNRNDAIATDDAVLVEETEERRENVEDGGDVRDNGNWVLKILQMRSLWRDEVEWRGSEDRGSEEGQEKEHGTDDEDGGGSETCSFCGEESENGCTVNDDGETIQYDRDSFSKLLKRVSLEQAKLYYQMSYLGSLAYSIRGIRSGHFLKYHGLRFVTSSLERREQALKAENLSAEVQEVEENKKVLVKEESEKNSTNRISASTAYRIAASAASYLYSHTRSINPFTSFGARKNESSPEGFSEASDSVHTLNEEVASLMATTDSVTAVVAAKEEVKQAVADDLNSSKSSPCEWFICDDDKSATRLFVIQGSESLASWKANLLFEPVRFEGFDVLVHRGIYEAAKGIYEQMLPEVRSHLNSHGSHATFRFTGHSLGGSLSLLVNLMLLTRSELPPSSLLPVITFGAPSIMCGGDRLLRELGLPRHHLQSLIIHRDIVPRAFSCNYPYHVAELLKAVNGNFRSHPCLNKLKLLYSPMGESLILQPEEELSPNHHLLPSGSGLYLLTHQTVDANEAEKQIRSALSAFLNSPHPLEILSDRSAYGSEGTIRRDHDMDSYRKSLWRLYRRESNRIRKARKENRLRISLPFIILHDTNAGIILGSPLDLGNLAAQGQFNFSGILHTSKESLLQFSKIVTSAPTRGLLVVLFPTQLLIFGIFRLYRFINLC